MRFIKDVAERVFVALILITLLSVFILLPWLIIFGFIYFMYTFAGIPGALCSVIGILILFIYFFMSSEEKE